MEVTEITEFRFPVNKVIVGDCKDVMQGWPDECIDLVVTSPPYWGLRDYGDETVKVWGSDPECEHDFSLSAPPPRKRSKNDIVDEDSKQATYKNTSSAYNSVESNFCVKCGAWRGGLGMEPHPQLFIDHLVEIFREVKRVLKPSGTFWLNLGDTYFGGGGGNYGSGKSITSKKPHIPNFLNRIKTDSAWLQPKQKLMIPARVAIALQHEGWILRSDIIWHKPNHMPSSVKDRLTCSYEHVFLFAKQRRYYFDLDAIRKPHKVAKLRFPDRKIDYKHKDGPELRGLSGSASRQYFQTETATAWNPLGKNPGDVWETKDEKLTKHDIAVGRIGNFSYTDPLHTKEYHPKGKNPGDLWFISTQPFKGAHFAVFPSALIEPIVKAGCPKKGVVLDPFGGSGTVGKVARKLGRRFIIIEIKPEYADMAWQRIRGRYKPVPEGVVKLTDLIEEAEK